MSLGWLVLFSLWDKEHLLYLPSQLLNLTFIFDLGVHKNQIRGRDKLEDLGINRYKLPNIKHIYKDLRYGRGNCNQYHVRSYNKRYKYTHTHTYIYTCMVMCLNPFAVHRIILNTHSHWFHHSREIHFLPLLCQQRSIESNYGFSSGHVWMWESDHKENWEAKNWCFWTVMLEKTLESPLDCKEIKVVNPKGNQSWIYIGRTYAEAKTPIRWPPDEKNWLIGKNPDAGKDWRQEEKGTTEDEMVEWHHWLNEHEFEQAPGIGNGQGSLACCSPWGCKESDTTKQLIPSL